MHRDHKVFAQAIKDKKKVLIKHHDGTGGDVCTKVCRPLFYISDTKRDSCAHYYFWDGERDGKGDVFWVAPAQIVGIEPTQESFDPAGFTFLCNEEPSQASDSPKHRQ